MRKFLYLSLILLGTLAFIIPIETHRYLTDLYEGLRSGKYGTYKVSGQPCPPFGIYFVFPMFWAWIEPFIIIAIGYITYVLMRKDKREN